MSDELIFFSGPLDAPAGLVLPAEGVPVTLAHDWTRPLIGTATVTPVPEGYRAEVQGRMAQAVLAALMTDHARLAGAWDTDAEGVSHLLSIGVVPHR